MAQKDLMVNHTSILDKEMSLHYFVCIGPKCSSLCKLTGILESNLFHHLQTLASFLSYIYTLTNP